LHKLKLTINELKRQKDALKRFQRFLPTLILKKQNIQLELYKIKQALHALRERENSRRKQMDQWVAVFGEDASIRDLIKIDTVETEEANVAGVDTLAFKALRFTDVPYDLYATPLWFDRAIQEIRAILTLRMEIALLGEQIRRLEEELRITTQRVNLFEKVKIPQTRDNIRVIRIFLGDQQTAAVVRGKIAKGKLSRNASVASV
jgi:V/A-type H+-transporting ATPase subunit D